MSTPLDISIVVPLYNKAPFIGRCIDSIRAQTFESWEVVVVDDGSTDQGAQIVTDYDDARIRLICQENAGPGAARNLGIREATAEIISFLDADDEWLPTFLEHSLRLLREHPNCVAVVTSGIEGQEREDRSQKFARNGVTEGVWEVPGAMEPTEFKAAIDYFALGTTTLYRDVLNQYGGFYSKDRCNYGEDASLWIQVAMNHPVYRDFTPLTWIHTEDSQLGARRQAVRPPWPFLLDPDVIWNHCPPSHRALWHRCLAHYALLAARRHAQVGDVATARMLHKRYDLARAYGLKSWHYRRLRWEMITMSLRCWLSSASPTRGKAG